MYPGPVADTLRLRDEIARSLLDEEPTDERPAPAVRLPDEAATPSGDDRRDRSGEVDLLTGGGVPPERR